jgi:hypothetical protein
MRVRARYGWIGGAALALTAVAATPGGAASTPRPSFNAPVLISDTRAARETSMVLNPKNPSSVWVCTPSGVPATGSGQSYYYRSSNAGKSWQYTNVETSSSDTRKYAFEGGDCDVTYDQGGTMYSADTWVGNLSVGASRDGGKTWSGSAVSVTAPVVDRPWLVGGPAGTVYLSYHDLQCCAPSAMWFTKSTDYGKTFSPAVPVTTVAPGGGYTWEGNFVVAPNGKDIHLVYSRRIGGVVSANLPVEISLASSHDGGLTWATKVITTVDRETGSIYPSIGMDKGGYLHVAWSQPRDGDTTILYAMSKDGGKAWTKPRGLTSGRTGWAPWVAGGAKKGQAAIVWLGSPQAKIDAETPWFFYYAKIDGSKTVTGTTTTKPMYRGKQIEPEFEMVALDAKGKMHLGMSVYGPDNGWSVYYQREK